MDLKVGDYVYLKHNGMFYIGDVFSKIIKLDPNDPACPIAVESSNPFMTHAWVGINNFIELKNMNLSKLEKLIYGV